ncbi:MAG: ATP-binding protein [Bacteroidales bacterium]|nr:ATP-binding protein [Bacteroidales bacterium]
MSFFVNTGLLDKKMEGSQRRSDWLHLQIRRIPIEYREPFMLETGTDNLLRTRVLCLVLIAFVVLFSLKPGFLHAEPKSLFVSTLIVNMIFGLFLVFIYLSAHLINYKIDSCPTWLIRLPVIILSVCFLLWGCYACNLNPFGLRPILYFGACLFVVFSVFLLTMTEAAGIMLNGLVAFWWFQIFPSEAPPISAWSLTGLLFLVSLSFFISRVIFYRRMSVFLNWENISSMNSTLKWEIKNHQQTLMELEAVKNDLDRQVSEKTNFLSDANQQLKVEIAERGYADKVRNVLYKISGFVNHNIDLTDIIRNIHDQLRQILDVTNFMVGIYDPENLVIEPVFQVNSTESFEKYRLGRTLTSYVIRNKRPLVVDKKGIHDLVMQGEIEIVRTPANSWLGVPLMVENRVVGIVMVQSYDSSVEYDQSDLQLMIYASEHLAFAIDRYEVQSNLIKAKEKAEESDRLKSAFLSNLSHEIRTPMNAILGFTEMMAEPELNSQKWQLFSSRVVENSQRLLKTLTKMIELAKLQDNQMAVEATNLQVGLVFSNLRDDINSMVGLFKKTGLEIRFICDPEAADLFVLADQIRLKQVVFCLAENAVKFTSQGFVEMGCRKYNQRQLLFWVKDSGIGINHDELEHIFEWFIRGQNPANNQYQGTGLGLTVTKKIIELMQGQIWVESEPGQGSCFYFTLPAALPDSIKMIPENRAHRSNSGSSQSVHAV